METIAVFFGGRSNEHEISVITGVYTMNLLRSAGYNVLPLYLTLDDELTYCKDLKEVGEVLHFDEKRFLPVRLERGGLCLKKKPKKVIAVDCAINCCHGGWGEGGGLAAMLDWNQIVSASPAMPVSALFLDKGYSKLVLKGLSIPVVPSMDLWSEEYHRDSERNLDQVEQTLGYPVIVKPSSGGSSLGISLARDRETLKAALSFCFRLDNKALIETYLEEKRDLNLAAYCFGEKIVFSEIEEVYSKDEILSFREKYEGTNRRASSKPAQILPETAQLAQKILEKIIKTFSVRGIVRADFLLSGDCLYFNELNTVPGTLALYLFGETLSDARDFLVSLVKDALAAPREIKRLEMSGILSRQPHGKKTLNQNVEGKN